MKNKKHLFLGLALAAFALLEDPAVAQVPEKVRLQSNNFPDRHVRHRNFLGELSPLLTAQDRADATFWIVTGLANPNCISFESTNFPGHYLRHQAFRIKLQQNDGSALFGQDATFCRAVGLAGTGVSYRSLNFPDRYIRHRNFELWIDVFTSTPLFRQDTTFHVISLDAPP